MRHEWIVSKLSPVNPLPSRAKLLVRESCHVSIANRSLACSSSVLPFVQKILLGTATTKDYNNLGTYGSPLTTAYPWNTAVPKRTQ